MSDLLFRLGVLGATLWMLEAAFPAAQSPADASIQLLFGGGLFLFIMAPAIGTAWKPAGMPAARIGALMSISAAAVAIGSHGADAGRTITRAMDAGPPIAAVAETRGTAARIRRGWDGHYRAEVRVNDTPAPFLIDTGASIVLIPWEDAATLGLHPERLVFDTSVSTANGEVTVAAITIDTVRVGGVALHAVEAAVAPRGALHTGLLGMSFLSRLEEVVIRGEVITLRN